MTTATPLEVRELGSVSELTDVVTLQQRVWGFGELDVVPVHLLLTAAHHGGLVLAAYLDDAPVGMLFGFAGLTPDGRSKHCSHMTGVVAEARGLGVGSALKWHQRALLLERGVDLVTWTFDPLEARNAAFNLRHLGAWSDTYLEDVYGELDDDLNRGLPSDRLLVTWRLDDPAVAERASAHALGARTGRGVAPPPGGAQRVIATEIRDGLPAPIGIAAPTATTVLVEVPQDVQRLKRDAPEVAHRWRLAVRAALRAAFQAGYRASDVHVDDEAGRIAAWYRLEHPTPPA